jgi:hypothetical protein
VDFGFCGEVGRGGLGRIFRIEVGRAGEVDRMADVEVALLVVKKAEMDLAV